MIKNLQIRNCNLSQKPTILRNNLKMLFEVLKKSTYPSKPVRNYLCLMFDSILSIILLIAIRTWWNRRQKLGASESKAALKFNEIAILHLVHLLMIIPISELLLESLINTLRMKNKTDSEQMVHLLCLLVDLIILVAPGSEQLLGALNVQ